MRTFLIWLFALSVSFGAEYFVSTTGNDSNDGSEGSPFATVHHAVGVVSPGDTISILPGTYAPTASRSYHTRVTISGTAASPITMRGLGGRPVLDAVNITSSSDAYALDFRASHWIVRDIDVTRSQQADSSSIGIGILLFGANSNAFYNIRTYANEGSGIVISYGSTSRSNLIMNCDSYDNFDPLSSPVGGNSDGFVFTYGTTGSVDNVFDSCRAWNNSDDGFDLWQSEAPITIRNCWAFDNGSDTGDGNGFKLGTNDDGPRHRVFNSLAFRNQSYGFDYNEPSGPLELISNTAYDNGSRNFMFPDSYAHYFRNNLDIDGGVSSSFGGSVDDEFNSWNLGETPTSAEFVSIDSTAATSARSANGSLPRMSFLRLTANSPLKGAGTNVLGLWPGGFTPDIGAMFPASLLSVGTMNVGTLVLP